MASSHMIWIDESVNIYELVSVQKERIFPRKYFGSLVELLEQCIDDGTMTLTITKKVAAATTAKLVAADPIGGDGDLRRPWRRRRRWFFRISLWPL